MSRTDFEKLATVQRLDVIPPDTDNRKPLLVRRIESNKKVALLIEQLSPLVPATPAQKSADLHRPCSGDFPKLSQ